MSSVATPGSAQGPGGFAHQRARFHTWRQTRPFWGCFLAFVAGVEIYVLAAGPLKIMAMQGLPGFLTWSIALLAMALGGVTLFQPHLRSLTGLLVVILGPLSIMATNLGGLLVGMILLIVGGGLMLAWVPPLPVDDSLPVRSEPVAVPVAEPTSIEPIGDDDGPPLPPALPALPARPKPPGASKGKGKRRPPARTGLAGVLDTMFGAKPKKRPPQGTKRPPQKRPAARETRTP